MQSSVRYRLTLICEIGTQDIEKVDCIVGGQNVTLVDTPGFDDSKRSDTEILSLIAQWLQTSYRVCVLS
jgi:predicted GTPase